MKKSKLFKTISFSSLALLMGVAGTMAFAPLGASSYNLVSASETIETTTTSGLGLDPKNDPVVYTTESGLEIRMSNASAYTGTSTFTTNTGVTYTQNLTGFYYFTMGTYSGTIYTANGSATASYTVSSAPVNWVIIGLGSNTSYFLDTVASNLFSTWKTNAAGIANSNLITYGEYFFKNTYENTTPAGNAINNVVPSKSYVMEKVKASITTNAEIPAGCMLVISEKLLGQMYFNGTGSINARLNAVSDNCPDSVLISASAYLGGGNRYRYIGNYTGTNTNAGYQSWTTSGNAGGSLYNYINNLFSKNTSGTIIKNGLGFTQAQANLIVPQQLYTYYSNGQGYNYAETPSTDGGTYYTMFPLAARAASSSTKQNFCIEDYLNTNEKRVTSLIGSTQNYTWRLRSGSVNNWCRAYNVWPSGAMTDLGAFDSGMSTGVRPAMVMKLK